MSKNTSMDMLGSTVCVYVSMYECTVCMNELIKLVIHFLTVECLLCANCVHYLQINTQITKTFEKL